MDKTSTAYNYIVEDGSGEIQVKEWIDDTDPVLKTQMREEASSRTDHYVRIIGKMQDYEGKPSIVAYSVRKVSSGNELTHHLLEVAYSSDRYKKRSQIVGTPSHNAMGMGMMNNGGGMSGGFHTGNMSHGPSGGMNSNPISNDPNNGGAGNDRLSKDILNYLSTGKIHSTMERSVVVVVQPRSGMIKSLFSVLTTNHFSQTFLTLPTISTNSR